MADWFAGRFDIAFDQDGSGRLLPGIIGLMVFLATLALAGSLALNSAVLRWTAGLSESLTVQIAEPLSEPTAGAAATPGFEAARQRVRMDQAVDKALTILRETPGIASADAIGDDQIATLLEPWLGRSVIGADLPMPRLIEVQIADQAALDLNALRTSLAGEVPGAAIDDHSLWRQQLVDFARAVEGVSIVIVLLIGGAASAVVVYATRSGLMVHRETIEVLHLIGAQDSYVAGQFQSRAVGIALKGGLIGLALALATLMGLSWVVRDVDQTLLPHLTLTLPDWLVIAALPLLACLISLLTARMTVLSVLARYP
ncbi:MAG: cell division protein [Alphaproteobacteria bacterium]|nr:cell division protein [Alphaproteobacteria bacterium]